MENRVEIVCIGEMLIDFICQGRGASIKTGETFSKKAGGAPANVAAGAAKLGVKSGFVGKAGDDSFGRFLKETIENAGVDTSNMILDKRYKTSLAFVSLKEDGERDFEFIREPGADTMLSYEEIDIEYIKNAKILHFGSISLIGGETRTTLLKILKEAKEAGVVISYDPNLRLNLWKGEEEARAGIIEGLPFADIVKVSEEELEFITGIFDYREAAKKILTYGVKGLFITRGKDGVIAVNANGANEIAGYKVEAVDTTGAGDGFAAGVLSRMVQEEDILGKLKENYFLGLCAARGNMIGAYVTTKYGAIAAMPSLKEVNEFFGKE